MRDAHVIDMLMVCRDSSENTHFLVKGLNLGFRECPYVLLINLSDLERRFDNVLSNRDRDGFKAMLNAICSDMLAADIILEVFFGVELLCRKIPIISKICSILRHNNSSSECVDQKKHMEFMVLQ